MLRPPYPFLGWNVLGPHPFLSRHFASRPGVDYAASDPAAAHELASPLWKPPSREAAGSLMRAAASLVPYGLRGAGPFIMPLVALSSPIDAAFFVLGPGPMPPGAIFYIIPIGGITPPCVPGPPGPGRNGAERLSGKWAQDVWACVSAARNGNWVHVRSL